MLSAHGACAQPSTALETVRRNPRIAAAVLCKATVRKSNARIRSPRMLRPDERKVTFHNALRHTQLPQALPLCAVTNRRNRALLAMLPQRAETHYPRVTRRGLDAWRRPTRPAQSYRTLGRLGPSPWREDEAWFSGARDQCSTTGFVAADPNVRHRIRPRAQYHRCRSSRARILAQLNAVSRMLCFRFRFQSWPARCCLSARLPRSTAVSASVQKPRRPSTAIW